MPSQVRRVPPVSRLFQPTCISHHGLRLATIRWCCGVVENFVAYATKVRTPTSDEKCRLAPLPPRLRSSLCAFLLTAISQVIPVLPAAVAATIGSAFTYQGRLLDGGTVASGAYDLQFALFGAATGGTAVGSAIVKEDVPVTNGLFMVELDFGPGAFGNEARWLAMGVRAGANTGGFVGLPMRQALVAVPQSQYALVAGSVTDGSVTAGKIALGAVTAENIAAGQVVKSLNGLRDAVVLEAGSNVTLTTNGNRLQIAATGGSGPIDPAQVMSAVLANDGIGSGLSADFIDGVDSANLARKIEVEDRVAKDGDTMRGTLTLHPPNTAQALVVTGNRKGGLGNSVAYFSNRTNQTDNAPAVRIENTAGTSPDGAISVSNNGQGYIARFGNSSKYVASLETNGTLLVDASVATASRSALEVKNSGSGRLATFGNSTEGKLWIDKDGNLTTATGSVNAPGGLLTSGDVYVGGNLRVEGQVSSGNAPVQPGMQFQNGGGFRKTFKTSDPPTLINELSIHCPASGYLFISSTSEIYDGVGDKTLILQNVTGAPVDLVSFTVYRQDTVSFSWVLPVNGPGYVNLKVLCKLGPNSAGGDASATLTGSNNNFTAIYFPVRYQ